MKKTIGWLLGIALILILTLAHSGVAPARDLNAEASRILGNRTAAAASEIVAERSRYASVYQLDDQTRMMQISDEPLHYIDERGQWQPIDLTLTASNNPEFGLEATHNDYQAFFKQAFDPSALLQFRFGGAQVTFGVDAEQAWGRSRPVQARALGSIVTYPHLFAGVDLRYQLSSSEMLEEFIVSDPALAARIARIDKRMIVSGADWSLAADGSLAFNQVGTSRTLFTVPAPVMYELNNPASASSAIHFEVQPHEGYLGLSKVIEPAGRAWLTDPGRHFPVVIDDTVVLNDANLAGGDGTVYFDGTLYKRAVNRARVFIGKIPNQNLTARGFLEWSTTAVPRTAQIQSVGVYFHVQAPYGAPNTVNIVKLGKRISSYTNDNAGNKALYNQLATAPVYDVSLPNFQRAGDHVVPLGFDDYTFTSALADLQSRVSQHLPFGVGLVGSNETDAATSILGPADTTNPTSHPALILFYKGIKGSATSMLRPLRNTFYDGHYYWAFFRTNYGQYYYYSPDGLTWTQGGQLGPSDNQHHGEWYEPGNNQVWAAFAVQVVGAFTDIYFRQGTIADGSPPSITWTTPTQLFTATRNPTTDGFDFPTVIRDSGGNCWVMVRHVTETTTAIQVVESTDATCTAWNSPTQILDPVPNGGDSGVGGYIVPLTNGKLYFVYKDQYVLNGRLFDGSTWSAPETIDANAAFGVYSQGMSVLAVGDVVHLAYVGGDGSLRYNSRNGSWGTYLTLASKGPYWSPGLSLDLASKKLFVSYRKSSANNANNGRIWYRSGSSPYAAANWTSPVLITGTAYAPEKIFGAVSPGSVSPWNLITNYSGNGNNFLIYTDGSYGIKFYSMQH